MRYCYVQNNQIVNGPIVLPKIWNNITNFNLLDDASLISYGWLPHTFIETATEGQIIEGSTFEIFPDKVIETQISRDPTPEELQERLNYKWNMHRAHRDYALFISDWTQLPDNGLSQDTKNQWIEYRQQLRDLPLSAETPDNILFPTDPTGFKIELDMVPPHWLRLYIK